MNVARRDVLRGFVLLSGAVVTWSSAVACTDTPAEPPPPDPLADLAARARTDAATATAVAAAVPALATAAGEVAAARDEHASALRAEVDRARPPVSPASSPASSPAPPSGAQPPADPAAARTLLVDALTAAEKQAGDIVASVPRHRAGLVGSVAAGCASLREVLA